MGTPRKRRRFSREFKLEAVRLAQESGHSQVEVARNLGINAKLLYRWTRDHRLDPKQAFPGQGNLKERDRQTDQLQRENARLKSEIAFLRKASAYFAKNPR
jgi:transposase